MNANNAIVERALASLRALNEDGERPTPQTLPSGPHSELVADPPSFPVVCGSRPEPARESKPHPRLKAGPCRYDWTPGYEGLRLRCVTHGPHSENTIVFRQTFGGYDTLAEMLRLKVLTGEALKDAKRVQ